MSEEHILYEKSEHLGFITFNRTDKRNAFTVDMFAKLAEAMTEADDDDDVRCIVVKAAGQDFTTGLDLMNVGPSFRQNRVPMNGGSVDPWNVVGRLRQTPMVVAAHGRCFTLGTELALAADICVAASNTVFALKEVKVGIMPLGGGTFRFVQAAGYGNAMRYVLTGDEFDAQQALRLGVVQEVVEPGTHIERATELAKLIASNAPLAVRDALANAQSSLLDGWRTAVGTLLQTQRVLLNSEDAMEAAMAMMQRRAPNFQGK